MRVRILSYVIASVCAAGLVTLAGGCVAPVKQEGLPPVAAQSGRIEQAREVAEQRIEAARRLSRHYRGRGRNRDRSRRDSRRTQERARRIYIHEDVPQVRNTLAEIGGGKYVEAHFVDAPLGSVVDALALVGGANIVVADDIAGEKLTFRIRRARWRDALATIARSRGWVAHDAGEFVHVQARQEEDAAAVDELAGEASRVELLRLRYIQPETMKAVVAALFVDGEAKPLMSADQRTGSLVVKGQPGQINLAASLAQSIDKPVPQILIETFIVEAGKGFEKSLGARLGVDRLDAGGSLRVGGTADSRVGSGAGRDDASSEGQDTAAASWVVNLPAPLAAGGIVGLFDSDRLRVELTALEREGKTRIVSNPRVFTLDGHEAVIFQGDEVPYTSVSDSGTQTEFKEAGVRLAVTPRLVGNGDMTLEVTVNKDTVDTRLQNPPITRRQIDTTLLVADGEIVVIGGIYFDTRVNTETRVPFFGRIPLLGRLFRRSQDTRDLRELLVFIAPRVIGVS